MVAWVPKDDSTSAAIASLIDAAGLAGNQEGNGRPEPSIIARCNAAGAGEVFLVSVERLRGGWRRNVADRREAYRDCKGKGACPDVVWILGSPSGIRAIFVNGRRVK
jgi:hypothetical protein